MQYQTLKALFIAIALLTSSLTWAGKITAPPGQFFKDHEGGTIFLRGVNVSGDHKIPPYISMNASDLQAISDLGYNTIRLVFNWEAYEPVREHYSTAYLAYIQSIVDEASNLGIYSIIDFHQDMFSRFVAGGCGDGAPEWAVPAELRTPPNNTPADCSDWMTKGATDLNMHSAFSSFHSDQNGVKTAYINMARTVARHFANYDYVIGYDLINEPWGDNSELSALYSEMGTALREEDKDAILFIEPSVLHFLNPAEHMQKPNFGNIAYAPHFYDLGLVQTKVYLGTLAIDLGFNSIVNEGERWNTPIFLGEYGMSNEVWNVEGYMDDLYKEINKYMMSGAQWGYTANWTHSNKDGWNGENFSVIDDNRKTQKSYELRPFPTRVSGIPEKVDIANDGKTIKLKWSHSPSSGDTQIYAPKQKIWGNKQLKITADSAQCSWNSNATQLSCSSSQAGKKSVEVRECIMFWGWCL